MQPYAFVTVVWLTLPPQGGDDGGGCTSPTLLNGVELSVVIAYEYGRLVAALAMAVRYVKSSASMTHITSDVRAAMAFTTGVRRSAW
jgi:hypothetical protein